MSKSKHTVDAAKGRQDRDSQTAGAHGPQERQQQVSTHLHEKGGKEDRWYGQDND